MADATAHTVITFGHLTHALSSMCIICVLYCTQYRTALYCTVLSVLLFFEYLLFDVCITYSILSMYWNDGDCLCSIFPVQTQYFLFLLGVFLTANETYFICKGRHCLQTWKDDGKILENFAGKPGKYLRGKEPNIASRLSDTNRWEKLTFSNFCLYSVFTVHNRYLLFTFIV